jgi:TonB family protein
MRYLLLFLLSSLGLAPMASAAASDEVSMTGIASYTELRQPYYLGALYLDQPVVSAGQVLSSWGRRRMEMRITAQRWTPRRFSAQWTQALILNVEAAKLDKYADAFVQFNNLPRAAFEYGDHIVVQSDNKGRTRVSVNGTEMFRESKPGFFEVLLATWIGDKPPSTEFKQAILATIDSELLLQYDALKPGGTRSAAVAAWLDADVAAEEEQVAAPVPAVAAKAQSRIETSKPVTDAAEAVATAPTVAAAVVAAPAQSAAGKAAVSEELEALADSISVSDVVSPEVVDEPIQDTADQAVQVVAMAPSAAQPSPEVEEPQLDPEIFRLQQDTLLKLYRSSIIKRALRQVEYPQVAVRRGQEGTVVLQLTVDRTGNVLALEQTSATRYRSLNKAAVAAVHDAGKLPPVPASLEGEQITVSIPVTFALQ